MQDHFEVTEHDNHEATEKKSLKTVRTYGELVLVILLILHVLAFFAFRFVEQREIRGELATVAQSLGNKDFAPESANITQFPDGIIVLHHSDSEGRKGFYEQRYANGDTLVYSPPGKDVVVAKSENDINQESMRFAVILGALFLAEVLLLISWWEFVKDKIKTLFEVS